MINLILLCTTILIIVLAIILLSIYFLLSKSSSYQKENSIRNTKIDLCKKLLKKISGHNIEPVTYKFFSPKMGSNKVYYNDVLSDRIMGKKRKIYQSSINRILNEEKLYFRIARKNHASKSIWNITNGIEEVIGSSYTLKKKPTTVFFFGIITFLLSALGFLWPFIFSFVIYESTIMILNNDFLESNKIFIWFIILLTSLIAGWLSILLRQIYVYYNFLKISSFLKLTEMEIRKIKKIIFSKIFLSLGLLITLPIDFAKEFSHSWLYVAFFYPMTLLSWLLVEVFFAALFGLF